MSFNEFMSLIEGGTSPDLTIWLGSNPNPNPNPNPNSNPNPNPNQVPPASTSTMVRV